jgi:hypothetical protein
MVLTATNVAVTYVVRIREIQEYDLEVITAGGSRDAAKLARRRFLSMTVNEQAANSVAITERTFEVEENEFDEDELALEG